MQTITFYIQIPSTRTIHLDLPASIPPGPAKLLLVVQPESGLAEQKALTIEDLGWTEAKAAEVRGQLASFIEDWDDPRMDIYNDL